MKAIICTRYGPPGVLQPAEVPKPVPLDNEVLIRIHATTCHIGDVRVRGAILPLWMQLPFRLYMGILKPKRKILGMELSGVVEAAGKAVRRFKSGDAVLASSPFLLGGYVSRVCARSHGAAAACRHRAILELVKATTFSGGDFSIQPDGVCRLNSELARRVGRLALAQLVDGYFFRSPTQ